MGREKPLTRLSGSGMIRNQKKELGQKGEDLALRFLKKNGYRIYTTNYSCKLGEIDIIAKEKDTLAFIEVKTRTSTAFGPPQLAVNRRQTDAAFQSGPELFK